MNSRATIALTFASALLIPTLLYRIASTIGLESVWVPVLAAFAIGITACWIAPNRLAALFAAFIVGVPLGIFLDVLVDWFAFSRDRSLFPFEILTWIKIFAIPGIVGVLLGRVGLAMREKEDEEAI